VCLTISAHTDLTIAKKKKAQEFYAQVYDSPFGQWLREYARSFDALGHNKPDFLPQVAFMDPTTTHSVTIYAKSVSTILDAWAQIAYQQFLANARTLRPG
jgi:hypothetical protein